MNFDRDHNEGHLMNEERQALYETILKEKPETCFEIGTWKGGGSTFFISSALKENNKGILYTIDCDPGMYGYAKNLYETRLQDLKPFINFNCGRSLEIYPAILKSIAKLDFVFMDGENNADQTVKEYEMFNPYLKSESILSCHDWDIEKMENLKKIILNDSSWILQIIFKSITGFALFKRM